MNRCIDCASLTKSRSHYEDTDTQYKCIAKLFWLFKEEVYIEFNCKEFETKITHIKPQNEYGSAVEEFLKNNKITKIT